MGPLTMCWVRYLRVCRVLIGFYLRYIYPSSVEFLKNRPGFVLGHFRKMVLAPHLITETFRNSNNCNRTQFEGK
jgi:hypothetical protein